MQRKFNVIAAVAALGTVLAGCGAHQGDLGNKEPVRMQSVRYDMNGNRITDKRFAIDEMNEMNRVNGRRLNSNNIVGFHNNYRMEMSQNLAQRIAKLKPVKTANVMLTDHNAYVAVSLHDGISPGGSNTNTVRRSSISSYGTKPLPSTPSPGVSFNGKNMNNQDIDRTGSLGYRVMGISNHKNAYKGASGMNGVRTNYDKYGSNANNGYRSYAANGMNGYGNGTNGTYGSLHGNRDRDYRLFNLSTTPRYGTYSTNLNPADDVDRGIYRARGGVDANADIQLTEDVKNQIAAEVKKLVPTIDNVYVSANADFVDRMNGYWNDVKAGRPIQGFMAEFNAMVERVFPARVNR